MKIKMIVCDLDKTLLRTDGTFSAYTLDILEKCRSKGILLAFATARPKMTVRRFVDVVRPDIVITDGGALARIGDEVIYHAMLSKPIANKIIHILRNSDHVGFITASSDHGYLTNYPISPEEDTSAADYILTNTDFSKEINFDIYKITPEILNFEVVEEITALPNIAFMPFAGEKWGTFTHSEATKWQSIQKAAHHLNIDINNIAAFGDDFGDIEMLRGCGIGVAVENAIPEVKAIADQICDTNDNDGVAKWLEENLFGGFK